MTSFSKTKPRDYPIAGVLGIDWSIGPKTNMADALVVLSEDDLIGAKLTNKDVEKQTSRYFMTLARMP